MHRAVATAALCAIFAQAADVGLPGFSGSRGDIGTAGIADDSSESQSAHHLYEIVLDQTSHGGVQCTAEENPLRKIVTARMAIGDFHYTIQAIDYNDQIPTYRTIHGDLVQTPPDQMHFWIAPAHLDHAVASGYQTTFLSDIGLQGVCSTGVVGRHTAVRPELGRTAADPPGAAVIFGRRDAARGYEGENINNQDRFDTLYRRTIDAVLTHYEGKR